MRKARFTKHQIIAVLKSVEVGGTVKDVCREAGISEVRFYLLHSLLSFQVSNSNLLTNI